MADSRARRFRRLAATEHGMGTRMKRSASTMLRWLTVGEDAELRERAERISERGEELSRRASDHAQSADQLEARATDS
jgi:hypothetical protein